MVHSQVFTLFIDARTSSLAFAPQEDIVRIFQVERVHACCLPCNRPINISWWNRVRSLEKCILSSTHQRWACLGLGCIPQQVREESPLLNPETIGASHHRMKQRSLSHTQASTRQESRGSPRLAAMISCWLKNVKKGRLMEIKKKCLQKQAWKILSAMK